MIYRKYGKTDMKVSAIGFGGMRFEDQEDIDACASLVKACYDAGINYFDTAADYGKSEELLGVAFKEMKKTRTEKPFYVSTKTFGAETKTIRKDLETSLERMGLDYIDLYHIWCITTPEEYFKRKATGAIKEFERLKEEGLIKHICFSTHVTGPQVDTILKDYPFDGILLGYSAMNFAYRDAGLDAAAKSNLGVVVMNPLGGGIIPQNPDRFSFVKTKEDETVVEGALRFLINDPRITVALNGLSSKEQLAEAIRAVDGFTPFDNKTVKKIRTNLKEAYNELCTSCSYCDNCPEQIPIPRLMDSFNHYALDGGIKLMLDRIRYHWDIPLDDPCLRKCTRCEQCEKTCTQKLTICDKLEFICDEADKFLAAEAKKK